MSDDGVVVHKSWLRQYWWFALKTAVWLGFAGWLGYFMTRVDLVSGIAMTLFILERGYGYTFLGLAGKLHQQHVIDTKEATRRMWIVHVVQTVLLLIVSILLLFSIYPVAAALPLVYLPLKLFLILKLYRMYKQEPPGTYPRKGVYD